MSRYTRPCKFGRACRYLQQDQCWFYHPPQHYQPVQSLFRHNTSSLTTTRQQTNLGSLYGSSRNNRAHNDYIQLLMMLMKMRQSEKKDKTKLQENLSQKTPNKIEKSIVVNKHIVKSIQPQISLDKQKKWFFENCRHFTHFKECGVQQCSICLTKFEKEQTVSLLFCEHGYHTQCIQNWLKKSDKCPLCRKDFKQHSEFRTKDGYPSSIRKIDYNNWGFRYQFDQ